MSYRRRPPDAGQVSPDRPSKNASTIARKSLRSAIPIPTGTVASRVNHLQSLSKATATQNLPPSPGSRPGDSSNKRPNNPFAALFWRKAIPDKGQEVEIIHSLPEPTIARMNHERLQASYVPHQSANHRNTGHAGQRTLDDTKDKPRKRDRPTHAIIYETQPLSCTNRGEDGQRLDGPQEEKDLRDRLQSHLRDGPVPSRKFQSSRQTKPQRPEAFRSEGSNTTTSTIRRQSVRELFEDRGIERPAGLASPKISLEDTSYKYHQSKAHVSCHLCSFKNKYVQIECQKCGHHFCNHCPASSIFPHNPFSHSPKNSLSSKRNMGRTNLPAGSQNQSQASMRHKMSRPYPNSIHRPRKRNDQIQASKPTIRLPSFDLADSMSESQSTRGKRQSSSNYKHHRAPRRRSKDVLRPTMNELSSSFLLHHNPIISNSMRRPGATWEPPQEQQHPPKFTRKVFNYDHSMPRDIGDGYKPTSVPVTDKQQSIIQVITDAQNVEYGGRFKHTRSDDEKANPYYSKLDSRVQQGTRSESSHSLISRPPLTPPHRDAGTSNHHQGPEFIECYGYPRTGHDRCGSPVESGIVGECQHCLDDCDCLACRSTHHAVRCCIHKDHPSVLHLHRMRHTALKVNYLRRSLSLTSEERDAVISLKAGQLEGQISPGGIGGKLAFKYPVEYIDDVEKDSGKKLASFGDCKNGMLSGDLPDSNNNTTRRQSFPLTFEQPRAIEILKNEVHSSHPTTQPRGIHPVPNSNNPQSQILPLSGTMKRPFHESLKLEAEQKEQRSERLKQMVQKQSERKIDSTNKKVAKTERKIRKHIARLEREEEKLKSYEEDKFPNDRTLLLDYEIGRRSKRVPRQPSPLSRRESRNAYNAPNGISHDNCTTESSLTTSTSGDLDHQVDVNIGKRERFTTKSNAAGILGITVIVHMSNDEDMIFRLDAAMAESKRS